MDDFCAEGNREGMRKVKKGNDDIKELRKKRQGKKKKYFSAFIRKEGRQRRSLQGGQNKEGRKEIIAGYIQKERWFSVEGKQESGIIK